MSQFAPGWYPDPNPQVRAGSQRYWDGAQWTAHTAPPPLGERDVTPDGAPLAGWWQRVGAYVLDSLLVLVVGASCERSRAAMASEGRSTRPGDA